MQDLLLDFATRGTDMTNDIIRTINAGGTVMISKRTVEDAGRYAIYVYALLKLMVQVGQYPLKIIYLYKLTDIVIHH